MEGGYWRIRASSSALQRYNSRVEGLAGDAAQGRGIRHEGETVRGLQGPLHRDALRFHGHGAFPRMDGNGVFQRCHRVPGARPDRFRVRRFQHDSRLRAYCRRCLFSSNRALAWQAGDLPLHRHLSGGFRMHEFLKPLRARASRSLRRSCRCFGGYRHRLYHFAVVGAVRLLESVSSGVVLFRRAGRRSLGVVALQRARHHLAVGVHVPYPRRQPDLPSPRLRAFARQRAPSCRMGLLLFPLETDRDCRALFFLLWHVRKRVRKRVGHSFWLRMRSRRWCSVSGRLPAS